MYIKRITVEEYRNYQDFEITPSKTLTVLVGPNAVGKTNLIEAIQILTTSKSFRNPKWTDVIRQGSDSARLSLTATVDGRESRVDILIDSANKRTFRLNGVTKRRPSDATSLIPCVIFTPDDLSLAKGPAEKRRGVLDDLGEQLSKTYGSIKRDYLKTVRQRNAALKEGRIDAAMKVVLDEQLVRLGVSLTTHRRRLLQRVRTEMIPVYGRLADGETVDIQYESKVLHGVGIEDDLQLGTVETRFRRELEKRAHDEVVRQTTLVGPHRDDVVFVVDGNEARTFASQGQQRTLALAWKWAEVETIKQVIHKTPVLLLDDVMSELDSDRRHALTRLIQGNIQTFVTTTNTAYFDPGLLQGATVIDVGR